MNLLQSSQFQNNQYQKCNEGFGDAFCKISSNTFIKTVMNQQFRDIVLSLSLAYLKKLKSHKVTLSVKVISKL